MSETLKQISDGLADAVAAAGNSTVRVEARRRLPATGIAWGEDLIVTANHVVERNDGITIGLPDGSTTDATLIGRDPGTDLAVLRVSGGLTPVAQASDELRVGNLVLAVGRPGSDMQATLGVVSAIGANEINDTSPWSQARQERMQRRSERKRRRGAAYSFSFSTGTSGVMMEGAIQTDVVMYPGFSGGPLIDAAGAVRGLNTSAIVSGVSLTVPLPTITRVIDTLLTHGRMRKGFLGIGAQPARLPQNIAEEKNQETGLLVVQVESGSPAENGGLLVGDIVIGLDGQAVRHLDELLALLSGDRVGREIPFEIVRGGQIQRMNVTIGERV